MKAIVNQGSRRASDRKLRSQPPPCQPRIACFDIPTLDGLESSSHIVIIQHYRAMQSLRTSHVPMGEFRFPLRYIIESPSFKM